MYNKLKFFRIKGLFESLDVNLSFDEVENIYIGENGIGKTTILSTIFYTLKGKFLELSKTEFHSIAVEFTDGEEFRFTKDDLEQYIDFNRNNRRRYNPRFYRLFEELFSDRIAEFLQLKEEIPRRDLKNHDLFISLRNEISLKLDIGRIPAERELMEYMNKRFVSKNPIYDLIDKLKAFNKENEILYFPTFRRIEEDLNKLLAFSSDDEVEYPYREVENKKLSKYGELIKFGMVDVDTTIKELLEKIRETSISSFNQMTAILLKQYVSNDIISNNIVGFKEINVTNLEISLNRVGSEIGQSYKDKIIELVNNKKIYSQENSYLLNFINNLLSSHEQLRKIDKKIEQFVEVCNSYLVNKKYKFDASNLTLQIVNTLNEKIIPLTNLSSGEKQIISTFAKIYLEYEKDYIILFDEPELSLSIEWQEKFIPDIVNSGNCNQLICVTHSPFIFKEDRLFEISKEILDEIETVSFLDVEVD
ncbi:ATP-binding protein [Bacillus cereus]|uniref:AAA family ATPase n=1 Tax=Bacillus cereus TaxID=1396 RepID=UPI0025AFE9ED|nr:AAA family ATPase [Bacillus cereus]MCU4812781.1 ATP-binding protein [Bacillus cereus]WJX08186.1 AAA family ATPase [Bacillus cereus]